MHIALLAFGFPLTTCHILYSRIIFKIEYFYFLNRIDEWSFQKILGLHHVHNILGFHYTINYAVNLSEGQPQLNLSLCCSRMSK